MFSDLVRKSPIGLQVVIQENDRKLILVAFLDRSVLYLRVRPISSSKGSMESLTKMDAALHWINGSVVLFKLFAFYISVLMLIKFVNWGRGRAEDIVRICILSGCI
jgi:hypothetical protein